jgi:hypothetical protein
MLWPASPMLMRPRIAVSGDPWGVNRIANGGPVFVNTDGWTPTNNVIISAANNNLRIEYNGINNGGGQYMVLTGLAFGRQIRVRLSRIAGSGGARFGTPNNSGSLRIMSNPTTPQEHLHFIHHRKFLVELRPPNTVGGFSEWNGIELYQHENESGLILKEGDFSSDWITATTGSKPAKIENGVLIFSSGTNSYADFMLPEILPAGTVIGLGVEGTRESGFISARANMGDTMVTAITSLTWGADNTTAIGARVAITGSADRIRIQTTTAGNMFLHWCGIMIEE